MGDELSGMGELGCVWFELHFVFVFYVKWRQLVHVHYSVMLRHLHSISTISSIYSTPVIPFLPFHCHASVHPVHLTFSISPPSPAPLMTSPTFITPPSAALQCITIQSRKPYGYWTHPPNRVSELRTFSNTHCPARMPTLSLLSTHRRLDLIRAVQRYGGFAYHANLSGLLQNRRRRMFWQQSADAFLAFVRTNIQSLVQERLVQPGVMPALPLLRQQGRYDVVVAIYKLGGFSVVASNLALTVASPPRLPVKPSPKGKRVRKKNHYWCNWKHVEQALRHFANTCYDGHMPLQKHFIQSGRTDLLNAVRIHGGVANVARRAGLTPFSHTVTNKRPKGYWKDPAVLHAELRTFTTKYGYPGIMPRREQLVTAARRDIDYAINKHGGYPAVAADVHLVWYGPSTFWRVFRNVQNRLLAFLKKQNTSLMPSVQHLQTSGRFDLVHGIALHGGVMVVAARCRLDVHFPTYSPRFWHHPQNIQLHLQNALLTQPLEARNTMPNSVTLVKIGRADLATAVRDHGGWVYYAQRLGLRFAFDVRPQGFWQTCANVLAELLTYVSTRYGTWEHPGKPIALSVNNQPSSTNAMHVNFVPSIDMLKRDGRSDIAFAIQRYHGGMPQFASKHNLVVADDVVQIKPAEVLMQWPNYVKELDTWIATHGAAGIMPSKQDLISTGRHDLRYATYKHGGQTIVARRLQLIWVSNSIDEWLPDWLAMQAARLGWAINLRNKAHLLPFEKGLCSTLDRQLNGSVVGKYKSFMTNPCTRIIHGKSIQTIKQQKNQAFRTSKTSAKPTAASPKYRPRKITAYQLQSLRDRYKHVAPDDIIAV